MDESQEFVLELTKEANKEHYKSLDKINKLMWEYLNGSISYGEWQSRYTQIACAGASRAAEDINKIREYSNRKE